MSAIETGAVAEASTRTTAAVSSNSLPVGNFGFISWRSSSRARAPLGGAFELARPAPLLGEARALGVGAEAGDW